MSDRISLLGEQGVAYASGQIYLAVSLIWRHAGFRPVDVSRGRGSPVNGPLGKDKKRSSSAGLGLSFILLSEISMFWAFVTFTILSQYTPGPNNLMAMANGARFGVKGTLRFTYGVVLAGAVLTLLAYLFSGLLYVLVPQLELGMRILAASYMLCLAWWIFRARHDDLQKQEGDNRLNFVKVGFLLQFLNPKLILFCVAVSSIYLHPLTDGDWFLVACYIAGMSVTAFGANMMWAKFGQVITTWLSRWRVQIHYLFCLLILWCAWDLFWV